jgi:poly(3-hydroxybutyrate) depolymerase
VFNGHRWERHIYPRVRAVIYDNEPRAVAVNSRAQAIRPGVPVALAPIAAPAASAVTADAVAASSTGEALPPPRSNAA